MYYNANHHHHNCFTSLFPGPPGWAGARRELLDFMVQREINRHRHTDHPAECHSIWTNQCPPPPSPYFLQAGCPSCRPTNSVKALKASVTTQNKHKKLKPGLVASYNIWPENGEGLFWFRRFVNLSITSKDKIYPLTCTRQISINRNTTSHVV